MIKKFRLRFTSKRPAALKSAWRDLIDAGLLSSDLGILRGVLLADSPELEKVLEWYERDKAQLDVRMESSCQVSYEPHDLDSHAVFKLYPPDAELAHSEKRSYHACEECGRPICHRVGSLTWATDAVVRNCAVVMTRAGDLLLRSDLVERIQDLDGLDEYQLVPAIDPRGTADWSVVMRAPVALRVGRRVGFCHTCGGAVKSEALPVVEESYLGDANWNFMLSPDRPSSPCFSKQLALWVISSSPCLSWEHFKPVGFQTAI
jgi:hypothetical protein